ncbi:unknown [Klebsiella variicola CAG:634]|nr:unknown [Klebsiella variicola CAG:634]
MGIRFGEALLHAGRRRFIQQAKDHNPQATEDKARNNFIQAQPAKLLPDDHGQGANHHPGQRAVTGHARPHHREQHHRTKGGAEASPGVAHQSQHAVFRIGRQGNRHQGNHQHHHTAHPHQLFLAGVFTQEGFIQIFGDCAGADQQLTAQGGHHRRQNRRQQDPGNPRVKQDLRQFDKHALGILINRARQARVVIEVGNPKEADRHRARQAQDHPGHTDATSMNDTVVRIRRHKARQNMRLTEIAQPPAHQRNNCHEVQPLEHVDIFDALLLNDFQRIPKAADGNNHDHRGEDQGKNHQAGLHGVGPADGEETADEGIDNRRRRPGPQCGFITHAEGAFKQTGPRHNSRCTIDGKEQQNNQR